MWIDAAFYVPVVHGPLSNATHGADFSWLFGMIIAGVVYGSCRSQGEALSSRSWKHPS